MFCRIWAGPLELGHGLGLAISWTRVNCDPPLTSSRSCRSARPPLISLSMSESSDRESHDPLAFGREDTESEEPNEYVCSEDESSQTEGVVECIIERGEPSVDSGSEAYREMQMNYTKLEAIVDWVLALSHTLEVGSSNQASSLRSVGVAMASASEGVDIRVGVLLARRNTLSEVRLAELRTDYSVSPYVGLRLPTAVDVVRYPPEGSLLIFTDMYQHSFRLPFHPLV
ncbi:unnamed protein product [Prunus armeniaca]